MGSLSDNKQQRTHLLPPPHSLISAWTWLIIWQIICRSVFGCFSIVYDINAIRDLYHSLDETDWCFVSSREPLQGRLEEAQVLSERARDIMSDRSPSPQTKEPVAAYPTSSKPSALAQLHLPEALQKLPSTLSLPSEEGEVDEGPMEAIAQGLSRNFNSPVQGHHVVFDAPPGMLRPAANQPQSHSSNTRTRTRFATPSQGVPTTNDSQRSGNAPSQQSQPGRLRLFCCFGG